MLIITVLVFMCALIPVGALCVLQYFLAKAENPWLGRMLPILSGIISLIVTLFLLLNLTKLTVVWLAVLAFIVFNIPTLLFFIIYRQTRKRYIEKQEIEKMKIQEIE